MVLREMLVDDLDQVMKIENELFSPPRTKEGFFTYLTRKDAMFLVVEEKGEILAYCGLFVLILGIFFCLKANKARLHR